MDNPLVVKGNLAGVTKALRATLLEEVSHCCERCGKPLKRFELHHRDGCGLNWDKENLMVLCPLCHRHITWENNGHKKRKSADLTKRGRNSVVVAIRIHTETYTIIREMANKKGVTVSAFIKGKVEEYARLAGESTTQPDEYVVIGGRRFKKPEG